jgi:hypothetical protein
MHDQSCYFAATFDLLRQNVRSCHDRADVSFEDHVPSSLFALQNVLLNEMVIVD